MKKFIPILLILCILLFQTSCTADQPDSKSNDISEQTLEGTIISLDDGTIKLRDASGRSYVFSTDSAIILPQGRRPIVGDIAIICYYGSLDDTNGTAASRIELTDTDQVAEKVREILEKMTLEEKCGQIFFARCPDKDADLDAGIYHLGGYVLYARDFKGKTPKQVQDTIQSYQDAAQIPMLIAVDEEGGIVNRVSLYKQFRPKPFESPQSLYNKGGFELVRGDTKEKAQLLKRLGINVNLAPVCDVSTDKADYIYPRTFGKNAQETSKYVSTVISEMKGNAIGSVLKHFPGYGNNKDTHTGSSLDTRSLDTFESSDFLPFKAGIDAGAESVLISHNIVSCIDPEMPASLSPEMHRILRENLGFDGVIMTDDLSMKAISQYAESETTAVLAIQAGNDMLLCTDYKTQISSVLDAVKNGRISQQQVDNAVSRILCWKISLGLIG